MRCTVSGSFKIYCRRKVCFIPCIEKIYSQELKNSKPSILPLEFSLFLYSCLKKFESLKISKCCLVHQEFKTKWHEHRFLTGLEAGGVRVGSRALSLWGGAHFRSTKGATCGGRGGSERANRMFTPLLSWSTLLQVPSLGLGFEETRPAHNSLG